MGNRINLTLGIDRRAERRAVVEICAAIPLTVPTVLLDVQSQPGRLVLAKFGEWYVAVHARDIGESHEHFIKEESQPDAFAFTVLTHEVHTVIPVTGAHEWKAVLTESKPPEDGAHTVIV